MKRFLTAALLLIAALASGVAKAQEQYGNEWIDYSKTYYKLKVVETGLYKLDYAYLQQLGLANVNPQHLQLFRRGKEVSIHVAGEADGRLDQQDYMEFYGERNDGVLDQELYKDPAHQVHQLYSMYTDTAAYFLTVNPAGGNKRMREENPAPNGLTPEPYHFAKATLLTATNYSHGKLYGDNRMPWLDAGEGYFSSITTGVRSFEITNITNLESTGPAPSLHVVTVGPNTGVHRFNINTVNGSTRTIATLEYGDYSFSKTTHPLNYSDINIQNSKLTIQLAPLAVNGKTTGMGLAYAQVLFPQKSIFTGNSMVIYSDSLRSGSLYYEFSAAPSTVVAYDVSNSNNVVRIAGLANGEKRGFVINQSGSSRKVLVANTNITLLPAELPKRVLFRDIKPGEHNYIIVSNKVLMQRAGGSSLPAPKEYAAYRSSVAGGGYDTLLVFVDDLVNQFHYGDFSANSIRRFCSFMSTSPRQKHLLLLGKGVEMDRISYRNPAHRALDIVPTGGVPASDLFFTVNFKSGSYVPAMPTGRVSALTATDIVNYLDKVRAYDATPDGLAWRKNVLHLGGGLSASEIERINGYITNYSNIAKGPYLGASVVEKSRRNLSEVVETLDISKEVNEGVSLITFFGHSSPATTDLDVGSPASPVNSYRNEGKYPVMFMNGCNVGNAFVANYTSFGEGWLNTPKRGAIALVAHVAAGYPPYLNLYTSYMYSTGLADDKFYGRTLGEVQQEVIRKVTQTTQNDLAIAMVLETVLQGDPAVHMYNPSKPDYLIGENSFNLYDNAGGMATAASDSIVLSFEARNLGKAITDSITFSVKRTLPDNSVTEQSFRVGPVYNTSKVRVKLSNRGSIALGMNIFEVKADSPNDFEELNENNNVAIYQQYISASGLTIVTPSKYSIIGEGNATLAVQANSSKLNKGVYIEIDTTNTFDSPWSKNTTVAKSGFASWDVNLLNNSTTNDSLVYFWRARFDSYEMGEDTVWVNSSFRHIPNVDAGWSQSHKGQFKEVKVAGVDSLDQETGTWEFGTTRKFVDLKTAGGDIHFSNPPYGIFLDGNQQLSYYCGGDPSYYRNSQSRFYMFVFNNITLEQVADLPGQTVCGYQGGRYLFDTGALLNANGQLVTANLRKIKTFIDAVPEGYYVAIMGIHKVPFDNLPEEAKAAFRSIGSKLIDNLKTGDPFAIVGQKGAAPGTAQERTYSKEEAEREGGIPASSQSIALNVTLESNRPAGTITSTLIGPALRWNTLHHNIEKYAGGDDKYKLSLIGVDTEGVETVLQDNVTSKVLDISHISANQYPNLRLSAFLSDSAARTAPQLKQWFVLYDPVPEGVIRPDLVKASTEDLTLQASSGRLLVPMAFQNVTSTAFTDSLTVEVTLSGEGIQTVTSHFKIKPAGANETVYFNHAVATDAFDGDYRISFYVNPRLLPEQEYANNIYEVGFGVKSKLHPIMDVAFDGIHILDGDIVSPSPLISVTVKDENRHIFLRDPSKMSMVVTDPAGNLQEVELMNNAEVVYTPATENSDFKLEYKPAKLADGKYTLQVQAKDAAGKDSGVSPYKIGFEVVSESSISNFYPFPNPFSTKTNFIFTVTGSTIPEHIKIQILTITGKVVKEIMKEELGPLRIGNNKTEYAWDGTDMYGDKLANGVYLYRVVMSKEEEFRKHRNTFGDGSFKNGYGKLYILR
ncbi:C25 family cysteine peptidase [Pontibacter korlensis]|nr:C25 family cysteine peptidase [Pontibacter korlensis]